MVYHEFAVLETPQTLKGFTIFMSTLIEWSPEGSQNSAGS